MAAAPEADARQVPRLVTDFGSKDCCRRRRNLVHGDLKASNILAVGETVKISSEAVSTDDPAADIKALGITLTPACQNRVSRDGRSSSAWEAAGPRALARSRRAMFRLASISSSRVIGWTLEAVSFIESFDDFGS